jgi:hypothetical protein
MDEQSATVEMAQKRRPGKKPIMKSILSGVLTGEKVGGAR